MRRLLIAFLCLAMVGTFSLALAQSANIQITSPQALSDVSGVVEVTGTVNPSNLQSYFLEVANFTENPDTARWTPVSLPSRTPVTNGVIARWDTSIVPDGTYTLRLRVVLTSGQTEYVMVRPLRVANAGAVQTATEEPTPEGPVIVPRPEVVNELPVPVGGQMDVFDERAAELMREAGITWMKWQVPYTIGDASL